MGKKEIAKRYLLFIVGLFFSALGVAFTKHGGLGVTPISSIPNVVSIKLSFLTLGQWLIAWNCTLIVGQIIVLRSRFKLIQLLQVPLSFLFGWFTDLGLELVSIIPVKAYPARLSMVAIGIAVLGFGIALTVVADVIMNSGEAFVKAVSDTLHKDFGNVKIALDITYVLVALLLSLLFFNFKIVGIREGTILSAVFVGVTVKLCVRLFKKIGKR